jgi:hypothetical protein
MTLVSIALGKSQATAIKTATQVDSLTPLVVGGNIENGWDSFEPRSQGISRPDAEGVILLPDNSNNTDQAWIKTLYYFFENMSNNAEIHFPNYTPPLGSYFQLTAIQTDSKTLKFKSLQTSIKFKISTKYPSDDLPILSVGENEFTIQMPEINVGKTSVISMILTDDGWMVNAGVYVSPTVM